MVSDNPACAGRFLCEEYHPKAHDNSNISRCEAEANKLKKKVETIKDTIAAHDDSLFNERIGKLQTGLTCHHKFNSDTLHLISTGIQDNIAQLIEDLETASKKYKATYSIGSKTNVSKSRRKKEDKRKARKRNSLWLWKIERVELLLFFFTGWDSSWWWIRAWEICWSVCSWFVYVSHY